MSEKKILIIDDDPIVLFLHEAILDDIAPNVRIISFDSGKLAQEFIIDHQYDTFLLFLDINMPVMNGWALLDFLESMPRLDLSVLMVTSSVNDSDRVKALMYPIVKGLLIKPLNLDRLNSTPEGQIIKNFLDK